MRRVVVVGSSGSGKTTFARRLAEGLGYPLLEMDTVFHRGGWNEEQGEAFRAEIARFAEGQEWVADGNYTSQGSIEALWPRADTFIWLDLPKRTVMRRVIARTLRRVITREELWDGVREPWTNLYSMDPERNIVVWAWTRFDHTRDKYRRFIADGTWSHAAVHRLASDADMERFLAAVYDSGDPPGSLTA